MNKGPVYSHLLSFLGTRMAQVIGIHGRMTFLSRTFNSLYGGDSRIQGISVHGINLDMKKHLNISTPKGLGSMKGFMLRKSIWSKRGTAIYNPLLHNKIYTSIWLHHDHNKIYTSIWLHHMNINIRFDNHSPLMNWSYEPRFYVHMQQWQNELPCDCIYEQLYMFQLIQIRFS